jgi:hypothetical protein
MFACAGMESVRCDNCAHDVPARHWCVRCGFSLTDETGTTHGQRDRFAAAPGERISRPAVVSTIFPQLPSDSMLTFRASLAAGIVTVVVLAALHLFPVALVAAAVLVPLITVIYLYDVDVYEDEPLLVIGLTMLGGALGGVLVALLAGALSPADATLAFERGAGDVLVRGVVIPLVSVALILLPVLVLLRHRRFNDVLDGTTFGSAAAVSLTGAVVLVQSTSYLSGDVSPDGDVLSWILRLLTIAVAVPVLSAAVMGAAAASLWLRHRAPVHDRHALGPLGRPIVAIPVAAAALVAAALLQLYLPGGLSLAVLLLLAAVALVWLRRAIHLGLLQEAAEIAIGPEISCGNCGGRTAQHTFCSECGVALRALPKAPSPEPPPAPQGSPA